MRVITWLRTVANRRALDREMDEEMALHIELHAQRLVDGGMTPIDAMRRARADFGGVQYYREAGREARPMAWAHDLLRDLKYGARGLRRSPAFTAVATISLALGIGANTAIFGLIHAVLLARLPVAAATELVQPVRDLGAKGTDERFSRAEFEAMASGPLPMTMVAGTFASMDLEAVASNVSLEVVGGNYFDLLGVRAQRGRILSRGDDETAAPVAMVTDKFWRGRLNADSAVIGRVLKIDGHAFTVVGVLPPGFVGVRFPGIADLFMPYRTITQLGILRERNPQQPMVVALARAHGMTPGAAQRALSQVWQQCCAAGQLVTAGRGQTVAPSVLSLRDVSRGVTIQKIDLRGQFARVLLALMAGVGVLLLAACANVANLLLARGSTRIGELAVRRAMGASVGRLVRQLVIESLELSLIGAALGALLALWGTAMLTRGKLGDLSNVITPTLGPMVLTFTIVVSVASGLLFGVLPAVRVMASDLITPLKQGGRRPARGRGGILDRGLVALQVALALLLVSGAAMLVQTLRNLRDAQLGFEPAGRLVLNVETRHTAYERQLMTAQMTNEMLRLARAIPGVTAAGFASQVPIQGGRTSTDNVTVPGGAPPADGDPTTQFVGTTPGYFAALGVPFLAGRDIGPPVATVGTQRDVVINDLFAKKFFPGRDALGQTFRDQDEGDPHYTENRIVGVVRSAKYLSARAPAVPMYFVPIADRDWPFLTLVVRTSGASTSVPAAMMRAVAAIAPGIGQSGVAQLAVSVDDALIRERISASLAAIFGFLALVLVAVGLYGVMLYQVAGRTTEIGIRMALGARGHRVVGLVLSQSLSVLAIGLVVGVPLAILAGRAVASQLYDVQPYSISALAIAAGSLVVVAIAASLAPARRAVRIDPLTALRSE